MEKISFLSYTYRHIFLPLALGAMIYIFWGSANTKFGVLAQSIVGKEVIIRLRNVVKNAIEFPDFLIYQLPDCLWAYAFCATLILIWQGRKAAIISIITLLLGAGYEIAQYVDFAAGTFDLWDIVAISFGCGLAYFFTQKYFPK